MSAAATLPPLRFGAFFAPFHPVGQSPTLALEYDLDRVVALDRLGYDEAWFGEHHSGGYEIIGCPEIFIAAAAERTRHIKLGTGVTSLPYHHPWLVADRLVLLDQSGGFGTFLMLGHDWASPEATMKSYELFARHVVPHFEGQLAAPRTSHDWAPAKRGELFGRAGQAIMNAITTHVDEKKLDAETAAVADEAPTPGNGDAADGTGDAQAEEVQA
jgi:hypothetical protein